MGIWGVRERGFGAYVPVLGQFEAVLMICWYCPVSFTMDWVRTTRAKAYSASDKLSYDCGDFCGDPE